MLLAGPGAHSPRTRTPNLAVSATTAAPSGTSACGRLIVLADDRRAERGDGVRFNRNDQCPGSTGASVSWTS
jgi:hypothetical protein